MPDARQRGSGWCELLCGTYGTCLGASYESMTQSCVTGMKEECGRRYVIFCIGQNASFKKGGTAG